jgi:polyisoprenoid-binding protein YceI
MKFKIFIAIIVSMAIAGASFAGEWEIDKAHSTIGFSVKHMLVTTVRGSFGDYEASLMFDPEKPDKITASATIKAASITTNNEKRDDHLRGDDFFMTEEYPDITFMAKKVKPLGDGRYQITCDLTIRGKTKEIMLEGEGFQATYKNPWGQTVTAASLRGTINRDDFGVNWNQALETGGFLVSKEVELEIDLELVKKDN